MSRQKGKSPAARPWEPMQLGVRVPIPDHVRAEILTKPNGEKILADLESQEMWVNHKYVVHVGRREDGSVSELSIRRQDRKAAHDWRDFQRIKTEIAGAETEAFEIYPAESRLMDTANQYYVWVLPPGEVIPAGYTGQRAVTDDTFHTSKQRPIPEDWKTG